METIYKSCPFCGKEPIVSLTAIGKSLIEWYETVGWQTIVHCSNRRCNVQPKTRPYKREHFATKAWNKRG